MENILIPMLFVTIIIILAAMAFFLFWRQAEGETKYWKQKCIDGCKTNLSHYGIHQPDDLDK